jgi:hypothetical protein
MYNLRRSKAVVAHRHIDVQCRRSISHTSYFSEHCQAQPFSEWKEYCSGPVGPEGYHFHNSDSEVEWRYCGSESVKPDLIGRTRRPNATGWAVPVYPMVIKKGPIM